MRVQRSRMRRLRGRKPGSKSPDLKSGATEPAILSSGISCSPPAARPSTPAAFSIGSMERRRDAWPVRTVRRLRRKARARAESKSWIARIRSIPNAYGRRKPLDQRQFALRVEEVQTPRVEAQLHAVPRRHVEPRVDAGCELVATHRSVQELVGAKPFDDVDLHVERRVPIGHLVGDGLGPEAEGALLRGYRLRQLQLE